MLFRKNNTILDQLIEDLPFSQPSGFGLQLLPIEIFRWDSVQRHQQAWFLVCVRPIISHKQRRSGPSSSYSCTEADLDSKRAFKIRDVHSTLNKHCCLFGVPWHLNPGLVELKSPDDRLPTLKPQSYLSFRHLSVAWGCSKISKQCNSVSHLYLNIGCATGIFSYKGAYCDRWSLIKPCRWKKN